MKIFIHEQLLEWQQYNCICCGRGCRTFLVPLTKKEAGAIEKLENWHESLDARTLFVRHRAAGRGKLGLAKRADGRCVFLDDENLCAIHRKYGLEAKPLACQLFPFVFTPFAGQLWVGMRYDCTAVARNLGGDLTQFRKELRRLAKALVPAGKENADPPAILPRQLAGPQTFVDVNEGVLQIIDANAMPLWQRLHWLREFTDYLGRVKWAEMEDEDVDDVVSMLRNATLKNVQEYQPRREPVAGKTRKLLGQYLYLLCVPTTIVTGQRQGWWASVRQRWHDLATMRQLGRKQGHLPELYEGWGALELAELEKSFGQWPAEVDETIGRYMTGRVAGLTHCGPNYYRYSLVDGVRSLLLAVVTLGWLMRLETLRDGRQRLERADAEKAVLTIDGNMGYGAALGMGPAKLRLQYLSGRLEGLINWYCM